MSRKYPLNLRRLERAWDERIKSLRQVCAQIAMAAEQALQRLFGNEGSLIAIPMRAGTNRRRLDQGRSRD
jgi:hypothetical protein